MELLIEIEDIFWLVDNSGLGYNIKQIHIYFRGKEELVLGNNHEFYRSDRRYLQDCLSRASRSLSNTGVLM